VFRKNPEAFIDNNKNLLRTGATLTVPSFEEMSAIPRGESLASFREQLERFNAYQASVREKQEGESSETLSEIIEESVVQEEQAEVAEEVASLETETLEAAEVEQDSAEGADLPDEESGEATLTIGQQIGGDAVVDGGDNAAQLEVLRSQLAQLDESLLASGVESDSVKQNLKQIQDQVSRLSTLIEVEDSNLAMAQNRAADAGNS
jgi:pilus assembly protein FimV